MTLRQQDEVEAMRRRDREQASVDRMFPIQGDRVMTDRGMVGVPGAMIPWGVAEVVYRGYSHRYGTSQSLERLAERGGFGWDEVAAFYPEGLRLMRESYERIRPR